MLEELMWGETCIKISEKSSGQSPVFGTIGCLPELYDPKDSEG